MVKLTKSRSIIVLLFLAGVFLFTNPLHAADDTQALKSYVDTVRQSEAGMTMWEMVRAGGFIMVVLLLASVVALSIVVYCFMTIDEKKLCPQTFADDIARGLEEKDLREIRETCVKQDNMLARAVIAGIDRKKRGEIIAKEAMEDCARKEIASHWQNVVYLGDIATVSPLIGLLGTVLGMIQAFNVIAFQTAVVKPILLAGGVSKAMVTTAGGLIVAIPTLIFYSFFRGRIQQISNKTENYIAQISN